MTATLGRHPVGHGGLTSTSDLDVPARGLVLSAEGPRLGFTSAAGDKGVPSSDRRLVIGCGALVEHLRLSLVDPGVASQVSLLGRLPSADLITVLSGLVGTTVEVQPHRFMEGLRAQCMSVGVRVDLVPAAVGDVLMQDRVPTVDPVLRTVQAYQPVREAWQGAQVLPQDPHGCDTGRAGILELVEHLGLRTAAGGTLPQQQVDVGEGASPALGGSDETRTVVLSTSGDGSSDWAAVGQALTRLMVLAARAGLTCSVMEHADDPAALRTSRLTEALAAEPGQTFRQMVVRLHAAGRPAVGL